MEWLANNWDAIMTLLNTIGLLFISKVKANK